MRAHRTENGAPFCCALCLNFFMLLSLLFGFEELFFLGFTCIMQQAHKHYFSFARLAESFYGSAPNFSLTKSSVLKPAPGRISSNTVPLAAPTSPFDSPFCEQEHIYILETFCLAEPFLVSSSHKTFVQENIWFWGGVS